MDPDSNGGASGSRDAAAIVAHFVVNHRRSLLGLGGLLVLISAAIIFFQARFASDVLDLLPQHFDAVGVFKRFDREFSQAREVTIGVLDETGKVDLDAFVDDFAEKLRAEPWVERVMEKSPMESGEGVRDVQRLAAPLLMNLPAADFAEAIKRLEPKAVEERIHHLRAALESGSPKAEFDLSFDPLGVIGPALKPLAGSFSVEQTRPLASPDGTLRVVLALTRQKALDAKSCQLTMQQVNEFRERVLAAWQGPKPQILVTGRTAYVGELSIKMRDDVIETLITSVLLVAVVFWIGFRRVRPLFAIVHALMLCCVLSVAFGALVFQELNMITIGLCAILVGLGIDFGMILLGVYQAERDHGLGHEEAVAQALREQGRGIFFGSLTTAAAFLCLLVSECSGFMQLGVLIAFGILAASGLMMTVFFVLLGGKHTVRKDSLKLTGAVFVGNIFARPKQRALAGLAGLGLLAVAGYAPIGHIGFEANPKTLEPKNSRAGEALRTIQKKMPLAGEPVLAVIAAKSAEEFHDSWRKAQTQWMGLVKEGRMKSANSPAAFAVSPERVEANRKTLATLDFAALKQTITNSAEREGLSAESLEPATRFIEALAGEPLIDPRKALPSDSPWWFVVDRFLAQTAPFVGTAYLTPSKPLVGFAEKDEFRRAIEVPGVDVHFSGWSYMLADLVPWAKSKLFQLTAGMIVFNVILLTFFFRRLSSIAILFAGLALAVGAMLATLKVAGIPLNLFNVLAFPLVLGVGVDYGIYFVVAMRAADPQRQIASVFKPVLLSGLTTVAGFASLGTAQNPALRGLGSVCAIGVGWCLFATFFFVLPFAIWRGRR